MKAIAACLLAEYATSPGAATIPAREITLTTWPRPAGTICSSAATVPFIVPTALIASIPARVGSSCSQARPVKRTPALLTQRSSAPASATTSPRRPGRPPRRARRAPPAPRAGADLGRGARRRLGVDVGRPDGEAAPGELESRSPGRARCPLRLRPPSASLATISAADLVRAGVRVATIEGRAERTAGGEKTPRGKSGHHRAGRWVTPTRGNPRESATEIHGRWRGHT